MRIATFNVNGINGRLSVLLRWLKEAAPDVVCLQELRTAQQKFPEIPIRQSGYSAIWQGQKGWNGVAILARGKELIETRRTLPGDPDDTHSRYIEAKELLETGAPVVLAGDYNVMPTDLDVYKPERWLDDALFRPEVRDAYRRLIDQGWTDALRSLHPDERIYTFWDYFRNAYAHARDAGLRIDHLLLSPVLAARLKAAGVDRAVRGWEKTSDHAPAWIDLTSAKAPSAIN